MVPLKYLSVFWRTREMPLINCEINILLTQSEKCIIGTRDYGDRELKSAIADIKLFVVAVTFSAQDNEKLLQHLRTGFKRRINWNKYQSDPTPQTGNRYVNHLINPNFLGVNRLFVFLLKMMHI